MLTFQLNFVLHVFLMDLVLYLIYLSNGFSAREVSFNGNVYGFLVDYSSIDKFDILNPKNIHKYLTLFGKKSPYELFPCNFDKRRN